MFTTAVTSVLLYWMCCELCAAVKVPVVWNDQSFNSDVSSSADDFTVEQFKPENANFRAEISTQPVPVEYFQYTAKKPQFAVDVAAFHGVQSPEQHYRAHAVLPHTGIQKHNLGTHHLYDKNNALHRPLQEYKKQEIENQAVPFESSYEVFHPYKSEEQALIDIYKDPVLDKIRSDLKNSKDRLQNYEKNTGDPSISKDEYLESPEDTDKKIFPHKNVPAQFEKHRPLRRPFYYQLSPRLNVGPHRLNQRFRHPLQQNYVKIRPAHYRPLHNHLSKLRQHHALKYDDEQNQYPQISPPENLREIPDGYDIFEKGKDKYYNIRNNVDESMNAAVTQNRPKNYENLELQADSNESQEGGLEFIPVKSYSQVRKTETTKHLPKSAALEEATSFDELKNAPRLKEAVKSTKAQTVYSEEGYEDSAYDHAGELKHASDHEGHGGYLKEKELSNGKYKIPSVINAHEDAGGFIHGDKTQHGKEWSDSDKDSQQEKEDEDYEDDDHDENIEADIYEDNPETETDDITREKRENVKIPEDIRDINDKINKTDIDFKVPEVNLNNTFLSADEILHLAKQKIVSNQMIRLEDKYPYYFRNLNQINKNSPLKYAENLRFIPKKSEGGSEFYDSRNLFECSEVDEDVDPISEKIKNNGTNNSNEDEINKSDDDTIVRKKRQADFDQNKQQPRLKGLGDKIDCFKAKYFGENPLDSPFFYEDKISDPDEITFPIINVFKENQKFMASNLNNNHSLFNGTRNPKDSQTNVMKNKTKNYVKSEQKEPINETSITSVLNDIQNIYIKPVFNISSFVNTLDTIRPNITKHNNSTLSAYKSDPLQITRRTRDTRFFYEPYKIVRDSQGQDSKKTTTTSNISPLIKQLQSNNIIDKVVASAYMNKSHPRQNVSSLHYKDIGRNDRIKLQTNKTDSSLFIDVSLDSRRGEPRYEMKFKNHHPEYKQVNNETNMSINDYNSLLKEKRTHNTSFSTEKILPIKVTDRPFFDVSKFLPPITTHQPQASRFSRRVVRSTTPAVDNNKNNSDEINDDSDEDEEEESEEEVSKENQNNKDYEDRTPKHISRKHRELPVPEDNKENVNENSDENNDSNDDNYDDDNDGSYEDEAKNTKVPIKKQTTRPSFSYVSKFVSAVDTPSSVTPSTFDTNYKNNTKTRTDQNADSSEEYEDDVENSTSPTNNTTKNITSTDEDNDKNYKYNEENNDKSNVNNRQRPFSYVSKFRSAIETPEPTPPMKIHRATTATITSHKQKTKATVAPAVSNEDYSEEYDDEEEEENTQTPVITTTIRPIFRRKNKEKTTKNLPLNNDSESKLKLVTRFRNENRKYDNKSNKPLKEVEQPKYREKSSKSSHRTILTDSQSYGNGDDDLVKDEIDAMIGVKHNMEEYLPLYEIKMQRKKHNNQDHEKHGDNEEIEQDAEENQNHEIPLEQIVTTESTKVYRGRKKTKPIIKKKIIAVHKETPVNDAQNTTHFKQDINEEEIIKEYPSLKSRKNLESLDLYKQKNLAEEVNKLSDVEVFKENLGTNPKHGGNYRSEKLTELVDSEVNDGNEPKMHGGNLKSFQEVAETSISEQDFNTKENDKLAINDRVPNSHRKRRQRGRKRQKITEDIIKTQNDSEDIEENTPTKPKHSIRRIPGNNRQNSDNSEPDVQSEMSSEIQREELKAKSKRSKINRNKAADLLSSLAQAVPILTTTPVYILDPSKRMYYYVDSN
ncbi:MATH and LRR domain-containing protein PFE0570w [Plutella xylostella]|uniref:MATH and LRR domain-containing protein PFE0570w n=1 Tax=Plutella xylostella TaxID=51655 RepID=UPI0020327B10|nr:MATH and LRR domain-containing protein PFE0570w [Plutella xylostella]